MCFFCSVLFYSCFIKGVPFLLGVYVPIAMVLLLNITIYILVLRVLWKKKQGASIRKASESARRVKQARASISLCFLLGVTWIVGLFMITSPAIELQWIFTVTNSLQGFALFFFYTVSHEKLHKEVGDTLYMSFTGKQRSQRTQTSFQSSSGLDGRDGMSRRRRVRQLWRNVSGQSEQGDDWFGLSRSGTIRSARLSRTDSMASNSSVEPTNRQRQRQTVIRKKRRRSDSSGTEQTGDRFSAPLPLPKKPSRISLAKSGLSFGTLHRTSNSSSDYISEVCDRSTSVSSAKSIRRNSSVSMIPEDRMEKFRDRHAYQSTDTIERRRKKSETLQSSDTKQRFLTADRAERFSAPLPPLQRRRSLSGVFKTSQRKRALSKRSNRKETCVSTPDLRFNSSSTAYQLPSPSFDPQAFGSVFSLASTEERQVNQQQRDSQGKLN